VSTKEVILDHAKELFARKGYRATTIRDIGSSAEVSSSAISYHFGSKEALLCELLKSLAELASESIFLPLVGGAKNQAEFRIKLELFIDGLIVAGLDNWELVKIILTESYELSKIEQVRELSFSSLDQLAQFLKKAKKNKVLRKGISEELLADQMMALMMDQILQWKSKSAYEGFDISKGQTRSRWINMTLDNLMFGCIREN
jgi:AcrR family transcriptional regulator